MREEERAERDSTDNAANQQQACDQLRSELEEKNRQALDELRRQLEEEKNLALADLRNKLEAEKKQATEEICRQLEHQECNVRQATENWSIANTYGSQLSRVVRELTTSEYEFDFCVFFYSMCWLLFCFLCPRT
jgi:hypothetical protein